LAAQNQILKQQKLNGKNHHIPINSNAECQWTQPSPIKRYHLANWIKKEDLTIRAEIYEIDTHTHTHTHTYTHTKMIQKINERKSCFFKK
jgi:hypothetical protein